MIPEATLAALEAYVSDNKDPGEFLRTVLSSDLMRSAVGADEASTAVLVEIRQWIRRNVPWKACGSPEKVQAWLEGGSDGTLPAVRRT